MLESGTEGRHPDLRLRRLPADVRDHHRRADQRRDRRPGQVRPAGCSSRSAGPPWSTSRSRTGSGAAAGSAASCGALDFAGGTAVHINAGAAALALALVLGKRVGWPQDELQAAQRADGRARRRPALVRLVRLQRRLRAAPPTAPPLSPSSTPRSRPPPRVLGWLLVEWLRDGKPTTGRRLLRRGRRPGRASPRPVPSSRRWAPVALGLVAGAGLRPRGQPEVQARLRRLARRGRRALRRRHGSARCWIGFLGTSRSARR